MLKKASTMKKDFLGWVTKQYKNCDEYSNIIYTYKWILENPNKIEQYWVVLKGTKIMDFILEESKFGVTILYPFFIDKCITYTLSEIRKKYIDTPCVVETEYVNMKKYGFIYCNMHTSVDLEHILNIDHTSFSVFNKKWINIMRDAIEEKYFPTLDTYSFKLIEGNEVNDYLYTNEFLGYPLWTDYCNHKNVIGFHYLQPDFHNNNKLLVAECKGVPIAAIKYGIYGENENKHYGLNYIDVKVVYRRQGLAKQIISEFAKILPNDLPLALTRESKMGEICKIEKLFKSESFKTSVYTYEEWLDFQHDLYVKSIKKDA